MRKVRKVITLVCLSFAVNACSCNRRHEVSFSNNSISNKTDENIVPQAYENLCKLAYNFIISSDNAGVKACITSIRYTEDQKIDYFALVDLGDGYNWMISVSLNYEFDSADAFVRMMSKMNLDTAENDYNAYAYWHSLIEDDVIIKLFDMDMLKALPDMDTKKPKIYIPYMTNHCCATYYDVNSSINTTTLTFSGSGATVFTEGPIYSYSPDQAEDKLIYDLMACSINEYNSNFANTHN